MSEGKYKDFISEHWDRIRQCPHDDLDRDISCRWTQCPKCGIVLMDRHLDAFFREMNKHERE